MQIPPNVEVLYTIVAQIDRDTPDEILFTRFNNTADVKTPDSGIQSSVADTVTVYPHDPKIIVVKTTPDDDFIPGKEVSFKITVRNRGLGYADEVRVFDDIKALNAFSTWSYTSETDSNNSPYKTGSYAGDPSGYQTDENLDARVDIDPNVSGVDGSVTFVVTGVVKNDYKESEISNTAETYDPSTNLNQSSSAEIGHVSGDSLNVSILKTADKVRFIPGEDVTYEIRVKNNGSTTEHGLKVYDYLNDIKSVLANDKDNQFQDFPDQNPFEYWQFKTGSDFEPATNDDFIYPPGGKGAYNEPRPWRDSNFSDQSTRQR